MASTLLSTSNYNGYDISCYNFNDGSVELFVSGSVPPYSYNWSNGGNQASLDSLFYGPHPVEVIDANGCTHWDSIILTQPDFISSSIISVNDYNGYDISCLSLMMRLMSTSVVVLLLMSTYGIMALVLKTLTLRCW